MHRPTCPHHTRDALQPSQKSWWRRWFILYKSSSSYFFSSIHRTIFIAGLLRFRSGQLDSTTMSMLQRCSPSDWVAMTHMAAGYGMMARKLTSQNAAKEKAALQKAARLFSIAEQSRTAAAAASAAARRGGNTTTAARWEYPQSAYAPPRTLTLRGWGTARILLLEPRGHCWVHRPPPPADRVHG